MRKIDFTIAIIALTFLVIPAVSFAIQPTTTVEKTQPTTTSPTATDTDATDTTNSNTSTTTPSTGTERVEPRSANPLESAKNVQEQTKKQFDQARERVRNNEANRNDEDVIARAQTFVSRTIDRLIKHLDKFKERVNEDKRISDELKAEIIAELDEQSAWLNAKKIEVDAAEDYDTLETLADEVREWRQTSLKRLHKFLGSFISAGVQRAIERYETAAEKVAEHITTLNDEGYDTIELDALYTTFIGNINDAEDYYNQAVALFDDVLTSDSPRDVYLEGRSLLHDATTALRTAHTTLQSITKALKEFKTVTLTGTGTLTAEGSGSAILIGNGTVSGTAGTGAIIHIYDNAGDAVISVDGTRKDLDNGRISYSNFTTYSITGTDIRIRITGSDLTLSASGTGKVILRGTGTFSVGDYVNESISGTLTIELTPA